MKNILTNLRRLLIVRPSRLIKKILPNGLFARTILILVIPTLLALAVATFVFFDRHWYTTTHRLTHAVAGDVSALVELLDAPSTLDSEMRIHALAFKKMDISIAHEREKKLPKIPAHFVTPLEDMMGRSLEERTDRTFLLDMHPEPRKFTIYIEAPDGLYTFLIPARRIYTPTTEVFIGWMIGSSILLSAIALLFMRNQIRPVRRLAAAAEAIGKGQDAPWFKSEGATEVRQASAALMLMRDRLRRAMNQRTTMLAGVSHDLRTPLTRMKLQLAMMPQDPQARGFHDDIEDMEGMLEAYLAFARGEEAEQTSPLDLGQLLQESVTAAKVQNPDITLKLEDSIEATIRPQAIRRCLDNLIGNALRYGKKAEVTLLRRENVADIWIDDDGEGIPEKSREDVFRPFFRLDASRNMETGGVGLGLSIARDIARAHGGDIALEESPQGGLRAHLWLPV